MNMTEINAEIAACKQKIAALVSLKSLRAQLDSLQFGFGSERPLQVLIEVVAEVRAVTIAELKSARRTRHLADSRALIWYLASLHAGYSVTHLGEALQKDHGSVCNARQRAVDLLEIDPKFKHDFTIAQERFLSRLNESPSVERMWLDSAKPVLELTALNRTAA